MKDIIDDSYEPSERDMKWYEEWALKHRRLLAIAREEQVDLAEVSRAISAVNDWVHRYTFYNAQTLRDRQTEMLDEIAARCLKEWDGKTMAPIEQVRKVLSDLREMWCVGKPRPAEAEQPLDPVVRVDGMDRVQALRHKAAILQQTADAIERAYAT